MVKERTTQKHSNVSNLELSQDNGSEMGQSRNPSSVCLSAESCPSLMTDDIRSDTWEILKESTIADLCMSEARDDTTTTTNANAVIQEHSVPVYSEGGESVLYRAPIRVRPHAQSCASECLMDDPMSWAMSHKSSGTLNRIAELKGKSMRERKIANQRREEVKQARRVEGAKGKGKA